jgi:hypothetical protein
MLDGSNNTYIGGTGILTLRNSTGNAYLKFQVGSASAVNVYHDNYHPAIAATEITSGDIPYERFPAGCVIGYGSTKVTAYTSITTAYTINDNIPTRSQFPDIITVTYNVKVAGSKIRLTGKTQGWANGNNVLYTALFHDGTSNALSASQHAFVTANATSSVIYGEYTTSATGNHTFVLGVAVSGGQYHMNASTTDSNRKFGGVADSILMVEEIAQ